MRDLPDGWKSVRLRDAGRWLSGGTPSTDEPRFWGGDIPWISAASLKDFRIADSDRRLTRSGAQAGTRLVPEDAVLFVVRGMSLKKEFCVGVTQRNVAFGQDCKAIIPHSGIDGTFLALAMKVRSAEILGMVDETGHGTGRLPTDLISKLEVGIPPLNEQRRIAEILDTLDAQIESAEDRSKKLDLVRAGLIANLIEIGVHGTADSWPRFLCNDAFKLASGNAYPLHGSSDGAVPIYGASGISGYRTAAMTSGPTFVIGRVGEGGVGLVHYVPGRAWITDNALWATRINSDWCPEFVAHYLSWFNLRRLRSQTGQPLITQGVIAPLPIPCPPLEEQKEIVSILRSMIEVQEETKRELKRLRQLKHGLMEDLLTGRVRVPEAEAVLERL